MKRNLMIEKLSFIFLASIILFVFISCNKDNVKPENNSKNTKTIVKKDDQSSLVNKEVEEPDAKTIEIQNLIKSGKTLIKTENWEKAHEIYTDILKKDPNNKNAKKDMELINKELKNRNDYVKAVKLFTDKKYKESIDIFETIPDKTTYKTKYDTERKKNYFEKLIKLTDAEFAKKDFNKAKELLSIANKIYKDHKEVVVRTEFLDKETKK